MSEHHEPTADRVEEDAILYAAGWRDALAAHPPCDHVHPAVKASVTAMFPEWDGIDEARARSIASAREWHQQTRTRMEVGR